MFSQALIALLAATAVTAAPAAAALQSWQITTYYFLTSFALICIN
jgi:hypothetical protein